MSDKEAVVKAAEGLPGFSIRNDLISAVWGSCTGIERSNGKIYKPDDPDLHWLLARAILEKMGWGIIPDLLTDKHEFRWRIIPMGSGTTATEHHAFADLPLAVIRAYAERMEGEG